MYRDRKLVRDMRLPVNVNEYEYKELQWYLDLTGDELSAAIRTLAMERIKQLKGQHKRTSAA
jgi:hypothetical protein